jgi:hypothetical protein
MSSKFSRGDRDIEDQETFKRLKKENKAQVSNLYCNVLTLTLSVLAITISIYTFFVDRNVTKEVVREPAMGPAMAPSMAPAMAPPLDPITELVCGKSSSSNLTVTCQSESLSTTYFSPLKEATALSSWQEQTDYAMDAYVHRARSENYLDSPSMPTYFINTYGVGIGDPFYKLSDVYDNALAVIYFVAKKDFAKASALAETFILAMTWHGYQPAEPTRMRRLGLTINGDLVSSLSECVGDSTTKPRCQYAYKGLLVRFMPDTTITYDTAGDLRSVSLTVDTGNNAFATMAICKLAAALGSPRYTQVCLDAAFVVYGYRCQRLASGGFNGFMGRGMQEGDPMTYLSVEHNIDVYALGQIMQRNNIADNDSFSWIPDLVNLSKDFYTSMFDSVINKVYIGSSQCGSDDVINTQEAFPVDAITWGTLAGITQDVVSAEQLKNLYEETTAGILNTMFTVDSPVFDEGCYDDIYLQEVKRASSGSRFPCSGIESHLRFRGFKFSDRGFGVQWENAGSGALALAKLRKENTTTMNYVHEASIQATESIKRLWRIFPTGIPAHFQKQYTEKVGNRERNTGLTWSYFRNDHAASTFWTAAALKYENDPTRTDDNDEAFNLYSHVLPSATLPVLSSVVQPPSFELIQSTVFPCSDDIIYKVYTATGDTKEIKLNPALFGETGAIDAMAKINVQKAEDGGWSTYYIGADGKAYAGAGVTDPKMAGTVLCSKEVSWDNIPFSKLKRISSIEKCNSLPIVKLLTHGSPEQPLQKLWAGCDETYEKNILGPALLAPGDPLRGKLQRCGNTAKMFIIHALTHLCM